MLVLLSPAKTINESAPDPGCGQSLPVCQHYTQELLKVLQRCTQERLKKILGVSTALASLNYERYKSWADEPTKAAAFAFDGPAYRALDAASLTSNKLQAAQQCLRIIDALYGILRPLDSIKPYRLEMSNKLTTSRGESMYEFWGDILTDTLNRQVEQAPQGSQFIINCASQEYFKAIDASKLDYPVYNVCFPGHGVHAKAARGAMARFIVQNDVDNPLQLQSFTGKDNDWAYDKEQSSEDQIVFKRSAGTANSRPSQAGSKRKKAAGH